MSPWTIIEIPLREPSPMPVAIDFLRFLATSITFMAHLENVEVVLDGRCIGRINKSLACTEVIDFPIALEPSGPSEMMVVDRFQCYREYRPDGKFVTKTTYSTRIRDSS